jgi:membrane protein
LDRSGTHFFIGFYIGKSVAASAYAAAGSLVVVIAWIYYSGLLLYFDAEFTRVYPRTLGSQRNGEDPSMLDVRLAAQGKPAVAAFFVSTGFRLAIFRE